jgi:hypothetical protein
LRPTNDFAAIAARNNALWCDAVCRVNGRPGEFHDALWLNRHGTPRFYPDAVTLARNPRLVAELAKLVGTDPGRGWAVKDSFAEIDLSPLGFEALFEAQWFFMAPPEPRSVPDGCAVVGNPSELAAWSRVWAGPEESSHAEPFGSEFLSDPDIVFASLRQDGTIIGGGILNRGGGAVGLSNLFAPADRVDEVWESMTALAGRCFSGLPLVGYERGADLAAARRNGFTPLGDLKVWVRHGGA